MRIWSELHGLFQTQRQVFVNGDSGSGYYLERNTKVLPVAVGVYKDTGTEIKFMLENGKVVNWVIISVIPSVAVPTIFPMHFKALQE